jgi:hypothetical protein
LLLNISQSQHSNLRNTALLTVTNVIPVDFGEEGMAAQALKFQSLFLATQQTLNQIKELTANFGVIRKLQKPLFQKKNSYFLNSDSVSHGSNLRKHICKSLFFLSFFFF